MADESVKIILEAQDAISGVMRTLGANSVKEMRKIQTGVVSVKKELYGLGGDVEQLRKAMTRGLSGIGTATRAVATHTKGLRKDIAGLVVEVGALTSALSRMAGQATSAGRAMRTVHAPSVDVFGISARNTQDNLAMLGSGGTRGGFAAGGLAGVLTAAEAAAVELAAALDEPINQTAELRTNFATLGTEVVTTKKAVDLYASASQAGTSSTRAMQAALSESLAAGRALTAAMRNTDFAAGMERLGISAGDLRAHLNAVVPAASATSRTLDALGDAILDPATASVRFQTNLATMQREMIVTRRETTRFERVLDMLRARLASLNVSGLAKAGIAGLFRGNVRLAQSAFPMFAAFTSASAAGALASRAFNTLERGIRSTVDEAIAFQTAMAEISTIARDSEADIGALGQRISDLSVALNQPAVGVAKGLYEALSAGFEDSAEAMTLLESASRLATAGLADTKETIDLLTSALNAYGMGVDQAGRLSDVFFETVRLGKTNVSQLSAVIGETFPLAQTLGVSIEEVSAAIATMTQQGFSPGEAAASTRALLKALTMQVKELQLVFAKTGETYDLNSIRASSFASVLDTLRHSVRDEEEAMRTLGGRIEASIGLFALTGIHAENFQHVLESVSTQANQTGTALGKMLDTDASVLQRSLIALVNESRSFGEAILKGGADAVRAFGGVERLQEVLRAGFAGLKPVVEDVTEAIAEWGLSFGDVGENLDALTIKVRNMALEARSVGVAVLDWFTTSRVEQAEESVARLQELMSVEAPSMPSRKDDGSRSALAARARMRLDAREILDPLLSGELRNVLGSQVFALEDAARKAAELLTSSTGAAGDKAALEAVSGVLTRMRDLAAERLEHEKAILDIRTKEAEQAERDLIASRDALEMSQRHKANVATDQGKPLPADFFSTQSPEDQQALLALYAKHAVQDAWAAISSAAAEAFSSGKEKLAASKRAEIDAQYALLQRAVQIQEVEEMILEIRQRQKLTGEELIADEIKRHQIALRALDAVAAEKNLTSDDLARLKAEEQRALLAQLSEVATVGFDGMFLTFRPKLEVTEQDFKEMQAAVDAASVKARGLELEIGATTDVSAQVELQAQLNDALREQVFLEEQLAALKAGLTPEEAGRRGGLAASNFDNAAFADAAAQGADLRRQSLELDAQLAVSEQQRLETHQALLNLQIAQVRLQAESSDLSDTELESLIAKMREANKAKTDLEIASEQLAQGVLQSVEANLNGMFGAFIDGTMDAREAFEEFARSVIKDVMRMAAVRGVLLAFGITPMAKGGVAEGGVGNLEKLAKGGIGLGGFGPMTSLGTLPRHANGIVSGPHLAMIGEGSNNEAVVPLPDNRSIPVKFTGGRRGRDGAEDTGPSQFTVNVNMAVSAIDTRDFRQRIPELTREIASAWRDEFASNPAFRAMVRQRM